MSFSPLELAFQAEDETIFIVPKQGLGIMEMGGWKSPQLRPMRRSEVPLWFAIGLKRQDRCSIVWPDWLSTTELKKYVELERKNSGSFAPLPWFWQIVSQMLLKEATDDYNGRVDDAMQLIQDLREIRLKKMRAGLLLANDSHLEMTGLGVLEINEVRPVLNQTMRTLHKVQEAIDA